MFHNYFKTALRSLSRHRSFSVINIAGLTLGLTAALLIALFVWDEYQYDRSIPGSDRVYRVYTTTTNDHGTSDVAVSPPVFAGILRKEYPATEEVTRVLMTSEYKQAFRSRGQTTLRSTRPVCQLDVFQGLSAPIRLWDRRECLE